MLIISLVVLGIASRLVPHPWNVTPVMAIALFGGAYLPKRLSLILPLVVLAISDAILGFHHAMLFTWGAFVLTSLIGWWIGQRPHATRMLVGALAGSALFFLLTNFGVWAAGDHFYPRTAAGLWQCYLMAIPFFRHTLFGDALYATALFGGYALLSRLHPAHQRTR